MKSGRTIVITSGKGGVGKTTSSANIAASLALLGNSVVVIDADIGLRNLDVVMGLENKIVYNLVDLTERKCRVRQALISDGRIDNLYLIAASQTRDKSAVTPMQMIQLTRELAEIFDFTVIDCPAGIERGFRNAIAGAKEAIVVTTPQVSAVRDADKILSLLKKENFNTPLLVINRMRADMIKKGEMMSIDDMLDILPANLLGVIPEDRHIVVSSNMGQPAVLTKGSIASAAYMNIARRLCDEYVPLTELDPKPSFIRRLAGMVQ